MRSLLLLAILCCAATAQARRSDAIFLLDAVPAAAPGYFRAAERYHAARIEPERDLLVTSAHSLQEVREWLARSPLRDGQPWGRIVLVAHGSPWRGALVSLWRDDPDAIATATDMRMAVADGTFPPLDDTEVDAKTQLLIESCGLGRRPDLLDLYAQLLGGTDAQRPHTQASTQWIEYEALQGSAGETEATRHERAFVASVQPGPRLPAQLRAQLHAQLRQQAPSSEQEIWQVAPIRIELDFGDAAVCAHAPGALLRQQEVRELLADHALKAGDLSWSLQRDTRQHCTLRGMAQVAVLGYGMPALDDVTHAEVSPRAAPGTRSSRTAARRLRS